ncbi:MAG TPA: hypothetical protein PKM78_04785 [Anaerolineae bacterium]|nr:hypothetical protein [Anaerolineae bacterium]HNU03109.1 hypothetical protein [Anaerolineae bacterium]
MKPRLLAHLTAIAVVFALTPTLSNGAGAAGPCAAGALYDSACDVDHDGDVDIFDIQLAAGHWDQSGVWTSDNAHDHLGQTWTGANNPLQITGVFAAANSAALMLSPSDGDALRITAQAGDGINVDSTGDNGLYVRLTGDDGVYVSRAGVVPSWISSFASNGFEVAGAEGDGLFVGRAFGNGVQVYDALDNGVLVVEADGNGVDATSVTSTNYGGRFVNTASGGAGAYTIGGGNAAADLILGGTASGDDGRIYSEPSLSDSDVLFFTNDEAHIHLDEDNNSNSAFVIYNGANTSVWSVTEAGLAVAAGGSAEQVDAGAAGARLAYAVVSPQRWIEDFGSGELLAGQVEVALEPVYAASISAAQPYHVFLTPLGDCPLYVAAKAAASFTVRALDGRQCSVAFDYRIVALRRGDEALRLEPFAAASDDD